MQWAWRPCTANLRMRLVVLHCALHRRAQPRVCMRRPTGCGAQVRAGTGGEEAALWAADLVRMYSKYADAQGWRTAHIAESQAESGGVKEAILQARLAA